MARDAEAQAAIDEVTGEAVASGGDVNVNWDDPKSVAKARGDETDKADDKEQAAKTDDKAAKADDKVAKTDDKAAKADDKDEKGHAIPKHRFDEVNERRKKAEGKLARYEAEEKLRREQAEREQAERVSKETQDAFEARERKLDELNDRFTDLISENKVDEAKQVRRDISRLEREIARDEAEALTMEASEQTVEETRLDKVIDRLEEDYPEFNPDGKNYNDQLVKMTLRLRMGYEAEGLASSEAMLRAAKDVMGNRAKGKPASSDANAAAIKRGLKAAEQQGADLDQVGGDSDTAGVTSDLPDPNKLTFEEFEALPESKKRRMRGDDRV